MHAFFTVCGKPENANCVEGREAFGFKYSY